MSKVTGIKSVDFKVIARGYGVVNWNGATALTGDDGTEVNNHTLPKLRGFSNLSGKVKDENGYKYKKHASEIDFKETPLYISQNCIRHHLFREQSYDLHFVKNHDPRSILTSLTGLLRGYMIPDNAIQCKRTSPLLITDFVDKLGNGNFEQMGRSGSKEKETNKKGEESSNSFFSKTTFGETLYEGYGSISIEQLQFISLDPKFDRQSLPNVSNEDGENIAKQLEDFIVSLAPERTPKAAFHENYVRQGTIFHEGETGILLDDEAIDILIDKTLELISELNIRQAKGYMYVDELIIDYNDSHKMMRVQKDSSLANAEKEAPYAVYFAAE